MPNRYKPGDQIDSKYIVLRKLGVGGMGAVLEVEPDDDLQHFALKYCTEVGEEAKRRFGREVRAMERVDHPNVLAVVAKNLEHDPPYFVMPIAKGSLDKEIPQLSNDHPAALDAFLDLCRGVVAVHAAIGPHRDLKPHNALRMPDGSVAVSDFGLAKIDPRDTEVLTKTTMILGTELYMAPEQRLPGGSRDATVLVDVYALGATLFHLLTGQYPATLDTSTLHPVLKRIIDQATARLPAQRYQTVRELEKAVASYLKLLRQPKDPLGVFTDLLDSITARLAAENKYSVQQVVELLEAVRPMLVDHASLLDEFDRIPDAILQVAAKNLPKQLADALEAFVESLDAEGDGRPWSYAEVVASRMGIIFAHASSPILKALAVRATLISAVQQNRYAAMDALEYRLKEITDDKDAEAVANALRDERGYFASQASRYRTIRLHPKLREVVRELGVDAQDEVEDPSSDPYSEIPF